MMLQYIRVEFKNVKIIISLAQSESRFTQCLQKSGEEKPWAY